MGSPISLRSWRGVIAAAMVLLALCVSAAFLPAVAQSPTQPISSNCTMASAIGENVAVSAARTEGWQCGNDEVDLRPERILLRFNVTAQSPLPRYLISRFSALGGLHLVAIDTDGSTRTISYSAQQLEPAVEGNTFKARLPVISPQTRAVVAAFDLPTRAAMVSGARLHAAVPAETPASRNTLLLLAGLCGMLLMPLLLNASFYRILREPFLIWHAILALSLMATVAIDSGLAIQFVGLSAQMLGKAGTMIFVVSVAAGGMFAYSFIEPSRMHPLLRRALPYTALWALCVGLIHIIWPFWLRAIQADLYYAAFAPVLAIYAAAVGNGLWRGSRAAKFQLAGWLPLLMVGVIRITSELSDKIPNNDAMGLFYVGCLFEVLATTMGVADRFMAIKHQRDAARTEARMLEQLSERDALTGMLNRRAIQSRFAQMRDDGFTTLAVLDLDHFKRVNDTFGHSVGDQVLKCAARALRPEDDNMLAFRMGGEEFVLLLRGPGSRERAERCRRAITLLVAQETQLSFPLTASMGMVEAGREAAMQTDLDTLYARADQLLYQAKAGGRNRMESARIRPLRRRKDDSEPAIRSEVA